MVEVVPVPGSVNEVITVSGGVISALVRIMLTGTAVPLCPYVSTA